MEHKNNPFKVPENYFDNLSNRLEAESKRKHVSVSKVLKYVASISLILALSVSVFVVVFTGDKKEPLLSYNFFSIFFTNKEKNQYNEFLKDYNHPNTPTKPPPPPTPPTPQQPHPLRKAVHRDSISSV